VYILIYKELELVLNLGSAFAKDYLNNMHPNIVVCYVHVILITVGYSKTGLASS